MSRSPCDCSSIAAAIPPKPAPTMTMLQVSLRQRMRRTLTRVSRAGVAAPRHRRDRDGEARDGARTRDIQLGRLTLYQPELLARGGQGYRRALDWPGTTGSGAVW